MHSESCPLHAPGSVLPYAITEVMKKGLPEEYRELIEQSSPLMLDYKDAVSYAHDMIGDLNHGMNRWIDWNLLVDETGGPRHVPGGFAAPLIAEGGSYRKTLSYHYIRQFAQSMRPEAVRIGTSVFGKAVEVAAVKRSVGLVLLNDGKEDVTVAVRLDGHLCETVHLLIRLSHLRLIINEACEDADWSI